MHGLRPALAVILLLPAPGWSQIPVGDEFLLPAYTTGSERAASVTRDSGGNFLVVWRGTGNELDPAGVFARRYDSTGTAIDAMDIHVNSYTTDDQAAPRVASIGGGAFVIVWTDYTQDGNESGVFGRTFDAAGSPGPEFRVSTYTTGSQRRPVVGADAAGSFIVAWESIAQDGNGSGIYAQRYDAGGTPLGSEFRVNTYTTGDQSAPSVAMDPTGNFVVVWDGLAHDSPPGEPHDIFARLYDTAGAPIAAEFRVNTATDGTFSRPSIAIAQDGGFVVAWTADEYTAALQEVVARRFDATGAPRGPEIRVNTYTTAFQGAVSIASTPAGTFVVAWESRDQDGSLYGAFARTFDSAGEPAGDAFRLNTYTSDSQRGPALAIDPSGEFLTVWEGAGALDDIGLTGRRFLTDPIFRDGFETGTLEAWSDTSTDGGDLAVSAAAAMGGSGTLGLAAFVDDTAGLFVTDDLPAGEVRYRARFYVDPNGFDPGEAQDRHRTRVFIAFADGPTRRVAAIVLRRLGGAYSVMGRVLGDDGTRVDTGFVPISDAPVAVEIHLTASSGPDALDGTFELWIGGVSQAQLTGIDNFDTRVDFVRMGALSVKAGAAGLLYFDEFESRRASYVGPLP